ncbi:glucose-1-phosphate thymidylyltransferase [Actinomadura sp. 7K507]|uniref:glucose-1-phosphate thymidylyltransferase n=1 Tax=Actinomadura sp. 7K507 TaxID=2530365 RepID=UPI0010459821|nr:glucose-1-phosphate thymidylyltransferase [Actinomadura sp. 7K507]TDC97194.1 glucose-1-phosphate thymidylyltransferase [Actinomadura sp. 7K507]
MKALVLSGGKGTRLRPFSHSLAKQLVPVAGRPVLVHVLERIRDIGVQEVGIIVGDNAEEIVELLGDGSAMGLDIVYLRQEAPLGLAHCVAVAADFLGDEDFVMYLGDNVLPDGIETAARDFAERRPDGLVLVTKVADPSQYGIAELGADGSVRALVEKPARPRSDLAIIGVYFLTAAVHDAVRAIRPSRRGELEITDALQHMVDEGRPVTVQEYAGYWADVGSIDVLLDCNRTMLERLVPEVRGRIDAASGVHGPVVVEAGAEVARSHLEGPLIVGSGTVVSGSRIGPNVVVGHGCTVQDAALEESLLLDGANVHGVHGLTGSIIGRGAEVTAPRDGDGTRLIVGDHSRAEVAA